jgi:plastocyanin
MARLYMFLARRYPHGFQRTARLVVIGSYGALALLLAFGVGSHWTRNSALAAETREIKIDNYSFSPGDVTVPLGTTVTWTNQDETPHTVVAQDGAHSFRSGGLDTDDKFSYTFDKAGTYVYICSVHPYMIGKIIVK